MKLRTDTFLHPYARVQAKSKVKRKLAFLIFTGAHMSQRNAQYENSTWSLLPKNRYNEVGAGLCHPPAGLSSECTCTKASVSRARKPLWVSGSECHTIIQFARETKHIMNNGNRLFRIIPILFNLFLSEIRKKPWWFCVSLCVCVCVWALIFSWSWKALAAASKWQRRDFVTNSRFRMLWTDISSVPLLVTLPYTLCAYMQSHKPITHYLRCCKAPDQMRRGKGPPY